MNEYAAQGALIRRLRKERGFSQAALAEQIHVSDKAVSKWERGAGLPDISLLPELAGVLGVSAETLLRGEMNLNREDNGSMRRIRFYRCPVCGSVMTGTGSAKVSCCDRPLEALKAVEADEQHRPVLSAVEDETLVTFAHPMEKEHHISFVALVGYDRMLLVRMYAEGSNEIRLPRMPGARLYVGCNADGLFLVK